MNAKLLLSALLIPLALGCGETPTEPTGPCDTSGVTTSWEPLRAATGEAKDRFYYVVDTGARTCRYDVQSLTDARRSTVGDAQLEAWECDCVTGP